MGGVVDFQPWRRAEFSYTFDGKVYYRKAFGSEKFTPGTRVQLLVDPKKPNRVMFREDVFPREQADTSKV